MITNRRPSIIEEKNFKIINRKQSQPKEIDLKAKAMKLCKSVNKKLGILENIENYLTSIEEDRCAYGGNSHRKEVSNIIS